MTSGAARLLILIIFSFGTLPVRASGDYVGQDRERLTGPREGYLVFVDERPGRPARDPLFDLAFYLGVQVYVDDTSSPGLRFTVHVPEARYRETAARAARFLAILWGLADRHFGRICARLRERPVDVWMTAGGEPGAEMDRSNLYVYDILAERSGIEWARELAHEFGHYLLPGGSGYTEPESWANGVLGERLFLKWLLEESRFDRMLPEDIPFVKTSDLTDYVAKQVKPLIDIVLERGLERSAVSGRDRAAMNSFTALMLYADSVHGSASILEMLAYLPRDGAARVRGEHFWDGFRDWLTDRPAFTVNVLSRPKAMAYLPAGEYRVRLMEGKAAELAVAGADVDAGRGFWTVRVPASGWRLVAVSGGGALPALRWARISGKQAGR